ncbi:hypothetical protein [Amycolatopsis sp. NBC_01480]|uniref:hypothetical protein n=1 Tax=Amycolatopsis sp. NBC_01480 TaxID=2903562 RepID=UPI002E2A6F15|nr:hypothetical protein [Amycolatopsis sp. NBC_01480]
MDVELVELHGHDGGNGSAAERGAVAGAFGDHGDVGVGIFGRGGGTMALESRAAPPPRKTRDAAMFMILSDVAVTFDRQGCIYRLVEVTERSV